MNRLSFSAQLIILALVTLILPLILAYIAIYSLPQDLIVDSFHVEMKRDSLEMSDLIRRERADVQDAANLLAQDPNTANLIQKKDFAGLAKIINDPTIQINTKDRLSLGPLTQRISVVAGPEQKTLVLHRNLDQLIGKFDTLTDFQFQIIDKTGRALIDQTNNKPSKLVEEVPLSDDYSLRLLVDDKTVSHDVSKRRESIHLTIGMLILASFLLAGGLTVLVNRRIRVAQETAETFTAGNYDAVLEIHGNDAFARLGKSFNELGVELKDRINSLKTALDTFETTVTNIEDGICLWENGEVILWSEAAKKLTGVKVLADTELEAILLAHKKPTHERIELELSDRSLTLDLRVTKTEEGAILQVLRDVTKTAQLEKMQRDFLATASHQMRTPLTSILGFSQTLTELDLPKDDQKTYLNLIHDEGKKLENIVNSFFTAYQLSAADLNLDLQPIKLEKILNKLDIDDVKITAPADIEVIADRTKLKEIIEILLDNVRKYGKAPYEIDISQVGEMIEIAIIDYGTILEKIELNRIFEPFYRIDPDMKSMVGGVGLGLYMAKQTARLMHGNIAASRTDKTTVFTLTLLSPAK